MRRSPELSELARDAATPSPKGAITLGHHPDGRRPETVAAAKSLSTLEPGSLPDHHAVSALVTIPIP